MYTEGSFGTSLLSHCLEVRPNIWVWGTGSASYTNFYKSQISILRKAYGNILNLEVTFIVSLK